MGDRELDTLEAIARLMQSGRTHAALEGLGTLLRMNGRQLPTPPPVERKDRDA